MSITVSQKRIISIFKTFIEKVFVPQLSKMDSNCSTEWLKFSNMISGDSFNYGQMQLYVNTLPSLSPQLGQGSPTSPNHFLDRNRNKSPFNANKSRKESVNDTSIGFNPSKTFGGERARQIVMQMEDSDKKPTLGNPGLQEVRETIKEGKETGLTTLNVLPTLQKIFKQMSDNHTKLDSFAPKSIANSTPSSNLNFEKKSPFYK